MCSGIEFNDEIHVWRDVNVKLPVARKDGYVGWVNWGERHGVKSAFVQGPCARLDSIQAGKWDKYSPQPVKIPIQRYMERDAKGAPYWVKVDPNTYLQGVLATIDMEQRVYVVTIETPDEFRHVQPRWPRVIELHLDGSKNPAN